MSHPNRAESLAHRMLPNTVPAPDRMVTASMIIPFCITKSMFPLPMPILIISATRVGIYNAPITSRSMTISTKKLSAL